MKWFIECVERRVQAMPPNRTSFPPSRQSVIHPLKKKQKQEPSRFLPCPVCLRSFPSYSIHDHVNICLDSPATGHTQSSPSTTSPLSPCNSRRLHLNSEGYDEFCSSTVDVEKDANLDDRLKNRPAEQDCTSPLLACSSASTVSPYGPLIENSSEIHVVNSSLHESIDERDGDARMPEYDEFSILQSTQDCRQTNCVVPATELIVPDLPQVGEREREAQGAMASPGEDVSDKPGPVQQIFQVNTYNLLVLMFLISF